MNKFDADAFAERLPRTDAARARPVMIVVGLLAMAGGSSIVHPQAAGFAVTPLLRTPLSGDARREVLIASGEFEPGGTTGRHTHPGEEYATVIEGTLEVAIDGQAPRRYAAGEAYHNVRGIVHETRNIAEAPARVLSTLIVDAGKPLSEPAK